MLTKDKILKILKGMTESVTYIDKNIELIKKQNRDCEPHYIGVDSDHELIFTRVSAQETAWLLNSIINLNFFNSNCIFMGAQDMHGVAGINCWNSLRYIRETGPTEIQQSHAPGFFKLNPSSSTINFKNIKDFFSTEVPEIIKYFEKIENFCGFEKFIKVLKFKDIDYGNYFRGISLLPDDMVEEKCYLSIIATAKEKKVFDEQGKESGQTALHRAVVAGNSQKVIKLIQAGIDKTKTDKNGKTAFDLVNPEKLTEEAINMLKSELVLKL